MGKFASVPTTGILAQAIIAFKMPKRVSGTVEWSFGTKRFIGLSSTPRLAAPKPTPAYNPNSSNNCCHPQLDPAPARTKIRRNLYMPYRPNRNYRLLSLLPVTPKKDLPSPQPKTSKFISPHLRLGFVPWEELESLRSNDRPKSGGAHDRLKRPAIFDVPQDHYLHHSQWR
ncbi:hypothetical protein Fmac_012257 [Flemingia macrophylla]|uniref:Uncharacterized protein n=1 Tax=Flemingia macrophylla TaxID=520843 RepID=A0ABD1MPS7_9FABA